MKKRYLKILKCVRCSNNNLALNLTEAKGDEVIEGMINCNTCGSHYPIVSGIACFLSPTLLPHPYTLKEC